MADRSVVGDLINFRGLVYSPMNENGVIFLFGKVVEDLNIYIEEIKPGYPDCIGRRFTGKGWERVSIEFEFESSNFKAHKHDPAKCDIIVCWRHDWQGCPIEVIELEEVIKALPNEPIERPDSRVDKGQHTIEEHLDGYPTSVGELFWALDERIRKISDEVFHKVTGRPGVTYYSPERLFVHVHFQKQGLKLEVFTRGDKIQGVKNFDYEGCGAKWGQLYIKSSKDVGKVAPAITKSYKLIKAAIKANEPTGWYAALDDETTSEEQYLGPSACKASRHAISL